MTNPRGMWDQRYAEEGFAYGEAPNAFFRGELEKLPAGKLLLPAEGEGRNALFAASRGWAVDALDFSDVARKKALAQAEKLGLSLHYEVADLADYSPGSAAPYDAIGLIFVHLPPPLRKSFHRKLIDALKPGGRVILCAYHTRQLGRGTGGPGQAELLYTADLLREDFRGMEMELLEERVADLDEGRYHRGTSEIVAMVCRKAGEA
ncbi:MAG: class I SAM-dependent methyltransferase [Spirochaetes bacterium]|nr:class I SAM-dependent methyltransferase [Spirochaetota bacterium]